MTATAKPLKSCQTKRLPSKSSLSTASSSTLQCEFRRSIAKELDIRSYLASRIGRGKVDFAMFCETQQAERVARIDQDAVRQYYEQLSAMHTLHRHWRTN